MCVFYYIIYILLFIRKTRDTELLWSRARAGSCMFVWIVLRMISVVQRDWIPEPPEPEREKDQKEANANPKKAMTIVTNQTPKMY